MTKPAYAECIYGLGGSSLDPVGGLATLARRIAALGVNTPAPFDQSNVQAVATAIKAAPKDAKIIVGGDSCGANKSPWVAAAVGGRTIDYMFMIQASYYCNAGCPPIGANVKEAIVFYSDWLHTWGLGVYQPQLAAGNKTTKIRYLYVPASHPDDQDVARIQNPILADIKRIVA